MFGWSLVRTEELNYYRKCYIVKTLVIQCHRWFSGWKDLDIIWDYILSDTYYGGIDDARSKYAKARGTDVYGDKKE